jgi:hypothetical protein
LVLHILAATQPMACIALFALMFIQSKLVEVRPHLKMHQGVSDAGIKP